MAQVTNQRFGEMIVEHIEVGNKHLPESEPGVAGAAMMQAAARFNAYVSSTQFVSSRIMLQNKDAHIEHYLRLYKQYLEEQYTDYATNFDAYTNRPR
ncbi:DUF3144 domain-containing protein [Asticcacaulis sp. AND118]|uniref:DUF3144 domain-containing protein n=1 Tax=Asticcacaulis sp. AND118 TaxID=2840468 RepID=UPI001CFFB9C4|nr:DUF3144 domain-containing protein [Asticcacaulis sp. AND118]UDF04173.1 DUF3144 domain-containing protein [Asticcacaulis sp. AND118]